MFTFVSVCYCHSQLWLETLPYAVGSCQCRDSKPVKALRISDCWVVGPKWYVSVKSCWGQWTSPKMESKGLRARTREECWETLPLDMMSLLHLRTHSSYTPERPRSSLSIVPHGCGEGLMRLQPRLGMIGTDGCWWRGSHFFSEGAWQLLNCPHTFRQG